MRWHAEGSARRNAPHAGAWTWHRGVRVVCSAVLVLGGGVAAGTTPTANGKPTAVITLGDSFISGEAGRWAGNAPTWTAMGKNGVWGTDRAVSSCRVGGLACLVDPWRVYGETYSSGCDRSDVAEVEVAPIAVNKRVNLACSGATTTAVLRAEDGGERFKYEDPQADQLQEIASQYDVKAVVVSIGGNDMNFRDIILACAMAYIKLLGTCRETRKDQFESDLAATKDKVVAALASIRRAMENAGYSDPTSYRLIVQTYPSPLPKLVSHYRYPEADWSRYTTGGCPILDVDARWATAEVVPRINQMLRAAAASKGADVLGMQVAFKGHQLCAGTAEQATADNTPTSRPSASESEWVRFISLGMQGSAVQESMHPNAFGQAALGECLGKAYAIVQAEPKPKAQFMVCTGKAHAGPYDVTLTTEDLRGTPDQVEEPDGDQDEDVTPAREPVQTRMSLTQAGPLLPFHPFSDPQIVANKDGRLEVFARTDDGRIQHAWQPSPGGSWSTWESLGGDVSSAPSVVLNADGRLEVFALDKSSVLQHAWQITPGERWSAWSTFNNDTGHQLLSVTAITGPKGYVTVFMLTDDGRVAYLTQRKPGGSSFPDNVTFIDGAVQSRPVAILDDKGNIQLFATDAEGHPVEANQSRVDPTDYISWTSIGNDRIATNPAAAKYANGRSAVFALDPAGNLKYNVETTGVISWQNSFISLGKPPGGDAVSDPAVVANSDGRLEVFVIAQDGNIYHQWQLRASGPWSGEWKSIDKLAGNNATRGTPTAGTLAVGLNNKAKTLQLIALSPGGQPRTTSQTTPKLHWGSWADINVEGAS